MQGEGKHLYGVIREEKEMDFGFTGIGERQDKVYTIHHQGLAAVVSDSPPIDYRLIPQEAVVRHLANHQYVIERVMKTHSIVPIMFGTMAEDEQEVTRILKRGYAQFDQAFEAMDDKVELEVVATWSDLDSVIKEIGDEDRIRRFREEAASTRGEAYEAARLELGKMVKSALDDRRADATSELVEALKECAVDHCPHDVMDDTMIMNVAFLIRRDEEKEFDEKVYQLDERYQGKVNFRCVGPLPPYSFSTMEIRKLSFEEVDAARNLLGLEEEATLSEVKATHRQLAHQFHPDQHPGDPQIAKRFEEITKAYRLLIDYCKEGLRTFREEDVKSYMLVRPHELSPKRG